MRAYLNDGKWQTRLRTTGDVYETFQAKDLMEQIAFAAWACADPGVQFDTTINDWHTCANTDRIHASNPCSEYMFLDDSACNLASINVMRYLRPDGTFDIEGFRHTVRVLLQPWISWWIMRHTDRADRPEQPSLPAARVGYANLGSLLMIEGFLMTARRPWQFAVAHSHLTVTPTDLCHRFGPSKAPLRL